MKGHCTILSRSERSKARAKARRIKDAHQLSRTKLQEPKDAAKAKHPKAKGTKAQQTKARDAEARAKQGT